MTARIDHHQLLADARIVPAPVIAEPRYCTDRSFELPPALLLGVFGFFMAYLGVMTIGFMDPGLALPMIVNVIFVAAFAYVPAKWAMMKPEKTARPMSWYEFREKGLQTAAGNAGAGEAATLVLLLPACVLFWGVAVVTIAALV